MKKVEENNYYLPEPATLRSIRASCPANLQKMQMSYEECRILSVMLQMIKAEKVLELGTLVGCSTAWIARSLCGNQPKAVSVEKSINHYNIAKANIKAAGLDKIVELINSDAISVLKSYVGKTQFDAIFIDAKKIEYSQYLAFAKDCVRSGGLIVADNTLMFADALGEIATEVRKFNHVVENDPDLVCAVLPTVAGMTVIIRK